MRNKNNYSLRGLRTFCVAARHESFRTAADELFVTASAVSHQIRSLEEEIGGELFERSARSIDLTELGQQLYSELNPHLQSIADIMSHYSGSEQRTRLRVSVQPFFASELFVPMLGEFTRAHPEIDLQIDTSNEASEQHPNSTDVSIRLFRAPPTRTKADLLFPLRLLPVGSPEFRDSIKVSGKRVTSHFPFIIHESRPRAWRYWSREAGITLPDNMPIIRLDSMIAVARAAERGLGAALVPARLSERWLSNGSLVPLFQYEMLSEEGYYLVVDDSKTEEAPVRQLRKWVLNMLAEQA